MMNEELRLAIAKAKGMNPRLAQEWKSSPDNLLGVGEVTFSGEYCSATRDWLDAGTPVYDAPDGDVCELPDWPGSIAAAWELVEEIPAEDWFVSVDRRDDGHWICFIGSNHDETIYWSFCEETAPRAICLAWLAWRGAVIN